VAAAGGRAAHGLRVDGPLCLGLGKVVCTADRDAGRLEPVLRERPLQLLDHRALHTHVGVAPMSRHPTIATPLPAGAGSAGDPETSIDDQDAAMVPIVRAVHA